MSSNYTQDERNDRQIILCGRDGQQLVNNLRIVVLGSDCVASEFLKNIVLHGFGNVTIIDDAIINEEDLRSNFLVDVCDLGKSRAESVAKLLCELNDINVEAINKNPCDLSSINLDPKPGFIISSGNLKPSFLSNLSKLCRDNNIPQGHIQSVGFLGAFYLDAGLHEIFQGPFNVSDPIFELHTLDPFPELLEYFNSFNFKDPYSKGFEHIPPPVVFKKAYTQLKDEGKPITSQDIKYRIEEIDHDKDVEEIKIKTIKDYKFQQRSSFIDAKIKTYLFLKQEKDSISNVFKVFKYSEEHPKLDTPFWRLVRATKRFYDKHNNLPHYGGCADLETETCLYLELKKIYKEKSAKDWEEIRKDLAEHNETVDEDILKRFAKNVFNIFFLEYKPISESIKFTDLGKNNEAVSTVQCLFIATRNFYEKNGRQPQNNQDDQYALIQEMKQIGGKKINNDEEIENYAKQFCISENSVIPSVAATIGAIFAQEVTKIVIHQAMPIVNGVFAYNGVKSFGSPFI